MTYNIEPLYLVPFLFTIVVGYAFPSKRKIMFINGAYFLAEWINHHTINFEIDRLIAYSDLYSIFMRAITFISFTLWKYSDIEWAKYTTYLAFVLWFGRYIYEKIMIEINLDTVEYDNSGNRKIISRPWIFLLSFFSLSMGIALKNFNILNPSGIVMSVLGAFGLLYSLYQLIFTNDYQKYGIRKRASYGEFYERKDINSGVYN